MRQLFKLAAEGLHKLTKQNESAGRNWALLISIISLVLSAIALWNSALAPADIKVTVSSPLMFIWRPSAETSLSGEPSKPVLFIKATCVFSNSGARLGEVSYFALRFQSDDGTRWLFTPYWVVDDAKLISDGFAKRTWVRETFHSIVVPGKQTVAASFMFFSESGLKKFENVTLTPHTFHVTLIAWAGGKELKMDEEQHSTLDFDAPLVTNLRNGVISNMPFVEQQKAVQSLE